jgi:hypothetical protein
MARCSGLAVVSKDAERLAAEELLDGTGKMRLPIESDNISELSKGASE